MDPLLERIKELEAENDRLKVMNQSMPESNGDTSITKDDSSTLLSITINLLEKVERSEVLQSIVEGGVRLLGLDSGVLYLIKGNKLHLEAVTPPLPEDSPAEMRIANLNNHHRILKAIGTNSPLMVNDINLETMSEEEESIVKSRNLQSMIFIPIKAVPDITGIMIMGTIGRKYDFNKREIDLCHSLSNIGSLALQNSGLFEKLNSNIDRLQSVIEVNEKSEGRLKLLNRAIAQSPVSIVITDSNGILQYVNPKFTEITGYSSHEAIGKNPRILKSGYHTDEFYRELWETLRLGKDWFGEMKNRKKNGDFHWENVLISPMTDENGRITNFVGIKEDITEKKLMLENLISAKEKAEESDRLKTAFLHNISHEIRTPLNAIIGFSTVLNDQDVTEEKRKEFYDIIIASNDQLLSIIDGIMRVAHLETGQATLAEVKTNIFTLVKTLYTQFSPVAQGKNLAYKMTTNGLDENLTVLTDSGKLKQILSNLLDNALKFTHNGKVEFGCMDKGEWLEFYVKDTGIGIPEDEHEKIFDRFYQVDRSKSHIYSGTGIGLSICAGYASLMGGALFVKSQPGIGSLFTLRLPLVRM